MKIHGYIFTCMLSILLAGCIGGIDSGTIDTSSGSGDTGDIGSPTLEIFSGDSQIVLAWTPDPSNPGDSYQLNRDSVSIYSGTDTGFNDVGLINGQTYCYTVAAVTGSDVATSAQRCATPMAGAVLAITNQSLAAQLNWAAVPGAFSYNIYLSGSFPGPSISKSMNKANGGGGDILIDSVPGSQTSYSFTSYTWDDEEIGLSNDCVTYPVKIVPVDEDGNESIVETTYQNVNPDTEGSLDTTFGSGDGYVQIATVNDQFTDVDQLSDGTIVVLRSGADPALTAFDDSGAELWEVKFDGSGSDWQEMETANAMFIDDDENIIVTGSSFTPFTLDEAANTCRLSPSGGGYEFDETFGVLDSGCTPIVYGGTEGNEGFDVIVDSEGRVLITGESAPTADPTNIMFALWRLLGDGFPDTDFAPTLDGQYLYDDPSLTPDSGRGILIADDGTIFASSKHAERLHVFRLDDDGNPYVSSPINTGFPATGITDLFMLDTGDLIAGSAGTAAPVGYILQEVPSDLSGVSLYFNDYDVGLNERSTSLQRDCAGRWIQAGSTDGAGDMLVFRADATTFLADPDFAAAGWYSFTDPAWLSGRVNAMSIDNRGRILAAGYLSIGGPLVPTLWRIK